MKVLFISHSSELYGAPRSLLFLASDLKSRYNVKPIVFTPEYGDLNKELDKLNISNQVVKLSSWVDLTENLSFFKKLNLIIRNQIRCINIKKIVRNIDIDLVHTNTSVNNIGYYIAKYKKVPHVWHIRETGDQSVYEYIYPLVYVKKLYQNTNRVIAISNFVARNFHNTLNINTDSIIYNGVKIATSPQSKNFCNNSQKIQLCIVGTLKPTKNQLEVLKAINILVKNNTLNFQLNIIGDGSKNYTQILEDYVVENNLKSFVKMWGYIEDVSSKLKKMDIGIISSIDEPFGRVTIEYMMHYMPVIGSNVGGTKELIIHNESGFLYELGNVEQLANYLQYFLVNTDKIIDFGKVACKYSNEKFSLYKNTDHIYDIYQEIL